MVKKTVGALVLVMVIQCLMALFSVSSGQVPIPREMPFGQTAASAVVTAAQNTQLDGKDISFAMKTYASKSDAKDAIEKSEIYGAYVTGTKTDTLLTSEAQSFAALTEIVPVFTGAAKKVGRPVVVQDVKPLPGSDPIGAVVPLLMLPALIGGLLASILVFKATATAPQSRRVGILLGYSVLGGLATALIAGPLLGAFSSDHFLALWGCLALVTAAVAFVSAALLAWLGPLGTIIAMLLVTLFGGSGSGASGVFLAPRYWQYIGAWLPPRQAINLIRNTLYFGGNSIARPIVILCIYLLAGAAVVWALGRYKFLKASKLGAKSEATAAASEARIGAPRKLILASMGLVLVLQSLYSLNYMSASHKPVAHNIPFGVTGPSSLTTQVQKNMSLKITTYKSEADVKDAIDKAKLWGALIPGTTSNTLLTVLTASALAPLQLQIQFNKAAAAQHKTLHVEEYQPVDLPKGDPFAIVVGLMLSPLLVGAYLSASMLKAATGSTAVRWRGLVLIGYALVAAMLINLIVGPWLGGYPTDKFWTVWLIMALIIVTVATFAAVMGRLLGAAGSLATMFVIILLGNPSSGGSNGSNYLPDFWNTIDRKSVV